MSHRIKNTIGAEDVVYVYSFPFLFFVLHKILLWHSGAVVAPVLFTCAFLRTIV
jgi:hypothetical protein